MRYFFTHSHLGSRATAFSISTCAQLFFTSRSNSFQATRDLVAEDLAKPVSWLRPNISGSHKPGLMKREIRAATEHDRKIKKTKRVSWDAGFEPSQKPFNVLRDRPMAEGENVSNIERSSKVEPSEFVEGSDVAGCKRRGVGIHCEGSLDLTDRNAINPGTENGDAFTTSVVSHLIGSSELKGSRDLAAEMLGNVTLPLCLPLPLPEHGRIGLVELGECVDQSKQGFCGEGRR